MTAPLPVCLRDRIALRGSSRGEREFSLTGGCRFSRAGAGRAQHGSIDPPPPGYDVAGLLEMSHLPGGSLRWGV
jgi:hypothetical protein